VDEYDGATVFCLPSQQEGFGLAFVEAMLAGKPVVAASAGAVPELVADSTNGFLVAPDDHTALADRLRLLLTDTALRTRMGEHNRRHASQHTAARMADDFLRAVAEVVAPDPGVEPLPSS
jgi:glycosyltransferase involved in cell wall biosynthesis